MYMYVAHMYPCGVSVMIQLTMQLYSYRGKNLGAWASEVRCLACTS